MMKKIRQEEKKDQENQERRSDNKNEVSLSTKSFFAIAPSRLLIQRKSKKIFNSNEGKSIDRSFDIFHPPPAFSSQLNS